MVETRLKPRFRASKTATIQTGLDAIKCVIRNLSTTGATIEVEYQIRIPDKFSLIVAEDNLNLSCQVVWRRGFRIGVTFDWP